MGEDEKGRVGCRLQRMRTGRFVCKHCDDRRHWVGPDKLRRKGGMVGLLFLSSGCLGCQCNGGALEMMST